MRLLATAALGAALLAATAPSAAAAPEKPDLDAVRACVMEFLDWPVIGGFYVEFGPGGEVVVRDDRLRGTVTFFGAKATGLVDCLT